MGKVGELIVKLGADNADLERGLKKARTDTEKAMVAINAAATAMVAVGTASMGAMAGAVKITTDWAAAINDLEDKTGAASETVSEWLYIGTAVGLTTQDMSDAMAKMGRSIEQAAIAQGKANVEGKMSQDVFTKYGIAIKDANGNLLTQDQIFKNVIARHREMANGFAKTNMEMEIFGRSGHKFNDMLNLSEKQMAEMTQRAHENGLVLSHETTQAWEDMQIQVNESKKALEGAAITIGNALMPMIQDLIDVVQDSAKWVNSLTKEEKENIVVALKLGAVVGGLGLAIKVLTGAFIPLIGNVKTAIGVLYDFAAAASAAEAAALGAIAAIAALLVYKAAHDASLVDNYGSDAFMVDPDNPEEVTVNTEHIKKVDADREAQRVADAQAKAAEAQRKALENTQANIEASKAMAGRYEGGGGGGGSSGGGGGGGGHSAEAELKRQQQEAEQLREKIKDLNEELLDAKESSADLAYNFARAGQEITNAGLEGSAKIVAELTSEFQNAIHQNEEWLRDFKEKTKEAADFARQAEETKDKGLIEQTKAYLEECKQAEIKAREEVNARTIELNNQLQQKLLERATQKEMLEADMKRAYDEGRMAEYQALAEQRLAMDTDEIAQRQQLMDAFYQWRQEAELGHQAMMINAMNTFKDGFSRAFADAIVGGKNLGKALTDLTKQIVTMYIQQRIQQALSAMFAKKVQAGQSAASIAAMQAQLPVARELALEMSMATAGASATAGKAAYMAAKSMGAVSNGFSMGGKSQGGFASKISFGDGASGASWFDPKGLHKFGEGGFIASPTIGLIGEVPHRKEAVFPLTDNVYDTMAQGIVRNGGGGNTINLHVSALDAQSFNSFLAGGGGRTLRQYLTDASREFTMNVGVV